MVNMPAEVRGRSAGELRSGGKASVAVSVIAVVKPTNAAQTEITAVGMSEDQAEECRQQNRAEQQKRPGAALQAIGQQKQNDRRHDLRAVEPSEAAPRRSALPWLAR